jgi:deoxyribodipyrimidine photolyase-related protein
MGGFKRGPWCDVVDGLYWRFVERHRSVLERNPRTTLMVRGLGRLKPERRRCILAAAESFLEAHTR